MNYAIFLKLCDRMRFEVNCAKSHHHIISEGLFWWQLTRGVSSLMRQKRVRFWRWLLTRMVFISDHWRCKAACKRTQQLPTLLHQQCWELLRPCWQWRANGCNNSQQCWDLQRIVGRIQPISLCNSCPIKVHGPNNVGRAVQTDRFSNHGTKERLGVVIWKV